MLSYLVGSIPTGYLLGKWLKGIDIRQQGSGNLGATNVFRVVGTGAGIFTLFLDFFKGFAPVWITLQFWDSLIGASLIGFASIAGHNWTVFLKFRGGKGVITSAGVFMALIPIPALIALGVFGIFFLSTGYVSMGSMVAALSLPFSTAFLTRSKFLTVLTLLCSILVIILHKKNIARLIRGEELKVLWK